MLEKLGKSEITDRQKTFQAKIPAVRRSAGRSVIPRVDIRRYPSFATQVRNKGGGFPRTAQTPSTPTPLYSFMSIFQLGTTWNLKIIFGKFHKDSESYFQVNLRYFLTPLTRSFDLIQHRIFIV